MSNLDLFGHVPRNDNGQRSEFDFYETPGWMTRSLLHFHRDIKRASVLEPCSGNDAIAHILSREGGCCLHTNDIDQRHPAESHYDAIDPAYWQFWAPEDVDWVITNPPFDIAFELLVQAHLHAKIGVAFLLRKTFLEPTEDRGLWLHKHPPTHQIGLPRHKFRADADHGDSVSCDWMIWRKDDNWGYYDEQPAFAVDHVAKLRTKASLLVCK